MPSKSRSPKGIEVVHVYQQFHYHRGQELTLYGFLARLMQEMDQHGAWWRYAKRAGERVVLVRRDVTITVTATPDDT